MEAVLQRKSWDCLENDGGKTDHTREKRNYMGRRGRASGRSPAGTAYLDTRTVAIRVRKQSDSSASLPLLSPGPRCCSLPPPRTASR